MDFILERFDGYNDLGELKSPEDVIIKAPSQTEGPVSRARSATV